MGQDQLPAEDMAALRQAVLGFYEESIGPLVAQRRGRAPRRLLRNRRLLWLNVLLLPVLLIDLVRMAVAHRGPEWSARTSPTTTRSQEVVPVAVELRWRSEQ